MINKSKFDIALTFVLVVGTWALVYTSILNTNSVKDAMDEQVEELRKSTQLQWRPYLHLKQTAPIVKLSFGVINQSETAILLKSLQSLNLSSNEFVAVESFHYSIPTSVTYYNSGATPLNITLSFKTLLTKNEWFNTFDKSPEKFVSSIPNNQNIEKDIVDLVILPDSSFSSTKDKFTASIDINEFLDLLKHDSEIVLYNCTYIEYEDFFENRYNALMIRHIKVPLKIENGIVHYKEKASPLMLEVYRWDVLLEEWDI